MPNIRNKFFEVAQRRENCDESSDLTTNPNHILSKGGQIFKDRVEEQNLETHGIRDRTIPPQRDRIAKRIRKF